jgi:hypothetical protein
MPHDEGHEARITNLEKRLDKIDLCLIQLKNRLPLWATMAISALVGIIGYLLKQ